MSAKSDKNNKKERTEKSPDAVTNTGRQESSDYRVMVFSTKRVLLAVTILNAALFFGGTLLSSITIKSITERYEKAVQIIKETEKDYYDAKSTLDNINREVDVLNAKIIAKIEDITKDINDKKIGAITKIDNSVTAVEQKQEEATPKITTALTTAEQAVSKITASVTAVEEKQEEATSKITTALTTVEQAVPKITASVTAVEQKQEEATSKITTALTTVEQAVPKITASVTAVEQKQEEATSKITTALTTVEQAVPKITASVTAVEEKQEEATSKITTALTNVEEKQEEATSKIDDVAKRIEPYYNKIIDMDKSLGELTRKVNVSKTRLEEAQKGADDLVTHARNIHSEIEEILANLVQNETFTFIDIWKHTDWMVKCVLIACVVLPLLLILYIIVRKPFKQNGLQR
jgi:uncharacterized phage infection (PIP) family protein YhgE